MLKSTKGAKTYQEAPRIGQKSTYNKLDILDSTVQSKFPFEAHFTRMLTNINYRPFLKAKFLKFDIIVPNILLA